MGPFTKREDFNAVVEGTYHDDWRHLNCIITKIDVPEYTVVLNDGTYKFELYGRTKDFESIQRTNGEAGDLEAKIDPLAFEIERPRTVCMEDGRIYVEECMATDKAYMEMVVPLVVKTAGKIFGENT